MAIAPKEVRVPKSLGTLAARRTEDFRRLAVHKLEISWELKTLLSRKDLQSRRHSGCQEQPEVLSLKGAKTRFRPYGIFSAQALLCLRRVEISREQGQAAGF